MSGQYRTGAARKEVERCSFQEGPAGGFHPEGFSGLRTIVIVADNNGDVKSGGTSRVKKTVGREPHRCFSVLLTDREISGSKVSARVGVNLELVLQL